MEIKMSYKFNTYEDTKHDYGTVLGTPDTAALIRKNLDADDNVSIYDATSTTILLEGKTNSQTPMKLKDRIKQLKKIASDNDYMIEIFSAKQWEYMGDEKGFIYYIQFIFYTQRYLPYRYRKDRHGGLYKVYDWTYWDEILKILKSFYQAAYIGSRIRDANNEKHIGIQYTAVTVRWRKIQDIVKNKNLPFNMEDNQDYQDMLLVMENDISQETQNYDLIAAFGLLSESAENLIEAMEAIRELPEDVEWKSITLKSIIRSVIREYTLI